MQSKPLLEVFNHSELFSLFFSSTSESTFSHSLVTVMHNSCYSISLCNFWLTQNSFCIIFLCNWPFLLYP